MFTTGSMRYNKLTKTGRIHKRTDIGVRYRAVNVSISDIQHLYKKLESITNQVVKKKVKKLFNL